MYYTYILRCADGSLYTGITTDVERRLSEHKSKGKKCAKYTLSHSAVASEAVWESEDRSLASRLEYFLKTLNKGQKERLVKTKDLSEFLSDKIEVCKYKLC